AFVKRAAEATGREAPRVAEAALQRLRRHIWPGNIRELRNVVERAVVLSQGRGVIEADDIAFDAFGAAPEPVQPAIVQPTAPTAPPVGGSFALPGLSDEGSPDEERLRIQEAIAACNGNQTEAARKLGISRRTLVYRLTAYGLTRPRKT